MSRSAVPFDAAPLVSVVIPYFERAAEIVPTLESVRAQTFRDWEVVLVDDASRDDPTALVASVIEPQRARVLRLARNGGASNARNVGVEQARGRFVAFLDSDDEWLPEKLDAQVQAVLERPDPDNVLCLARAEIVSAAGSHTVPARGPRPGEAAADYLFIEDGFAQTSSLFLSRRAAAAIGFATGLRQYEDFLFFIAAQHHGLELVYVDRVLARWRDDARPDRLSRGPHRSFESGRLFAALASDMMGRRARLAFDVRVAGPANLQHRPIRTLGLMLEAVARRVVTPRYAVWQVRRHLLAHGRRGRFRGRA